MCAGCLGGGQTENVTATGTPAGGTFTWTTGDGSVATAAGAGNTATVRGGAAGSTTVTVTYQVSGCTCTASVPVTAVHIDLQLVNTGKVTAAPENSTHDADVASAGGVDDLGPLPMGQGRGELPNGAYTSPLEVIGTVTPPGATGPFRWRRLITRRSWNIRHDTTNNRWNVTQRSRRGFPDDDTGPAAFNNPVPNGNHRIYIYDCSALGPGNAAADNIGDYIYEEKDFTYRVERSVRGTWVTCAEIRVGQVETVRRIATTGTVTSDWQGLENSTAVRTVTATIDDAKVRGIVGGSDAIVIDGSANN
ncbi:MAG TPA: Ig-like domain-containing protein [Acetobacteraceae bacterium]|nr:Ig-like domain-containing protein [Acetobacteraceae bacterium]